MSLLRVRRGLLAIGLATALGPLTASAQSSDDAQREAPEVKKLVLNGVKHLAEYEIERSIETEASECRSALIFFFCWISKSPTFVEKHHLDRDELQRDVLRIRVLYWKRGFREAMVDTSVTRNGERGVTVTFNITEGPPTRISALRVEYDSSAIDERRVRRLTLLEAGDPLDLILLDSARVLLQSEMWNRGYADAVIDTATAVNDSARSAALLVRITPNARTRVGQIVVSGNEKISTETILNTITLRPGEIFRRNEALESQRNLYESNLFRQALVNVPATSDSVKNVEIEVIEGRLREARVGGGFNSVDFFQVDGRFTHFNTLGGARRFDVTVSAGNLLAHQLNGRGLFRDVMHTTSATDPDYLQPTWAASVDFRQPAFLRRPENAVGLGVFGHRRSVPGIYIDRGYGASAVFTRTIRPRAPASATYWFEVTRVEASDVYFCINYGVCDVGTISALRTRQRMSPLSLTGFIDRTDLPFSPTKGYQARIDIEHASGVTLSDYRYNRAFLDAAAYTHFNRSPRNVLAGHVRLGVVGALAGSARQLGIDVLHPRKRFYAGGSQSVRGYAESQLGPRILTISSGDLGDATTTTGAPCDLASEAVRECDPNSGDIADDVFEPRPLGGTSLIEGSVEYRFPTPLHRKLDGAVFLDAAMVGESHLRGVNDLRGLARGTGAITPGFGIRYNSPVGPIRVDFGVNPKITEQLPVVTEIIENGQRRLVALDTRRTFAAGHGSFLNRFTLHLSIGQAY